MMRLIAHFIDLAQRAVAAGVHPERIARLDCVRPLQRMGDDIPDHALAQFTELEAAIDREFAAVIHETEDEDAAHG
jgi:hypothetical protein